MSGEDRGARARVLAAADPAALEGLRAFVRETAIDLGADATATTDLVQAVDEAACNTILHGYRGKAGRLEVEVGRQGDSIEVTLRDEAPPFDPTLAAPPDASAPRAWGRAGMGIHLLRSMMDEVHHRARPEGGNELTLRRTIHRPDEED